MGHNVLRSNHHLLDTVTELVYHTRWPKSHDKVRERGEGRRAAVAGR